MHPSNTTTIALDCTGVPNEVAGECVYTYTPVGSQCAHRWPDSHPVKMSKTLKLSGIPVCLILLGLFSETKMGILTSVMCTMRHHCTFSAWGPRSWLQRGRCSLGFHGHTKTNSVGLSVYKSFWHGLEQSWIMESMRLLISTPLTTRRIPACTMLLPQAWRSVLG